VSPLRRAVAASVATLALVAGAARGARAQNAVLTISGGPVTFPTPTGADYAAGYIYNTGYPASGVSYLLDVAKGAGNSTVTTTISVRAATATLGGPAGTVKPIGDLQWARADLLNWTSLTATNVFVESRQMQKNKLNDTWTNTLVWRMKLAWTSDPPGTYTTGATGIVVTLSFTAP
jgi:hypothetical protein